MYKVTWNNFTRLLEYALLQLKLAINLLRYMIERMSTQGINTFNVHCTCLIIC